MRTKFQEITFLIQCVNSVSDMIRECPPERQLTVGGRELVKRWQNVRRALYLDIDQLLQTISPPSELKLFSYDDGEEIVWHWELRQRMNFWQEEHQSPLNERVEANSTRRTDGS